LPVLGTPHPTCTEFYLRENGDYASARSSRIPPTLANDKSFPFPMYRSEEARLRGRKFSRRRDTTSYDSDDPAAGGLRRPKDENGTSGIQDSQNQTVYLLPKNLKFSFRVYFDNLTDAELGALLFALDLAVPDSWRESGGSISSPLFHALGHGTRLGMGRCSICIQKLQLDVMDPAKPDCRYRQSPDFASAEVAASPDVPETVRSVFSSSWRSVFSLPGLGGKEFKPVVADLMNLLQVCDGPLHYPNYWHPQMGSEVQYYDSFTWFMANRRGDPKSKRRAGHNKLPLPDEETSGTRRLPIDPAPG
jgi:hypothetical protein